MKKVIFTLTLFGILAASANATVRTVSKDPKAPAQFTSINTAIQASSNGDTILAYGTTNSYGDITVDREIVLIGAGYNNPYGPGSTIRYMYLNGAGALSASHTKISGFNISYIYFNGTNGNENLIEGVLIERCGLHYVEFDDGITYRDDTIRNCRITNNAIYFNAGVFQNIQIHNNIFDNTVIGTNYYSRTMDSVYVSNCVFLNRSSANVFVTALDITIENSIFYAAEPQGCTTCAFPNNMTFLNTNNQLVGSAGNPGCVGSGNHEDDDPQFVIYPPGGGAFSYSHDLNVQNANAINGGTEGTDMGIHGGLLPYSPGDNPSIPQMTELTFPANASSVKVGGTLDVTFKAKKQD